MAKSWPEVEITRVAYSLSGGAGAPAASTGSRSNGRYLHCIGNLGFPLYGWSFA